MPQTATDRALVAPRVPRDCPVSFVHLRTVKTRGGAHYGAHAFIITDHRGHLVEIISGDDNAEDRVFARWPWASTSKSARFGIAAQTWPLTVDVAPAEFDRLVSREPFSDNAARLRALADRCERHNAVLDAINSVRMYTDREHPAVIYHRDHAHGGDQVSDHVRRAFARFVRAGIVRRVDNDPPNLRGVCAQYRATDSTPGYR